MSARTNILTAIAALAGALALASCSVEAPIESPVEKVPELTQGIVDGELLVRFSPVVADILSDAVEVGEIVLTTKASAPSVSEVLEILKDFEIERVFPIDPRYVERSEKTGMNLWYVVRFEGVGSTEEVAHRLGRLGEVSRVEYNRQLKRADFGEAKPLTSEQMEAMSGAGKAGFNDPLVNKQWDLINDGSLNGQGLNGEMEAEKQKFTPGADLNAADAWTRCQGNPNIIVAILDEGVDVSHPDLKANLWVNENEVWRSREDVDGNGYAGDVHGYNFVEKTGVISTDSKYDSGHGTHVAGSVAAVNNNGIGIASIAGGDGSENSGVKIMSCQIFSGNKVGTVLDEVRAIKYAADNGATVLQCSWGYISGAANPFEWQPEFRTDEEWKKASSLEANALDYFVHNAGSPDGVVNGGIAVFAAGNESAPMAGYPGAYPDFVSVAALAPDFTPATYTNYGPGTTIAAPGGDQDYFYEYGKGHERGQIGCILSTLPLHVSNGTGYGYMEGTSMACPHVSGVVALGLSHAANLKKHFDAKDVIRMLHDSAKDIDKVMTGVKKTYKFTVELGGNHCVTKKLDNYRGKMGHGAVDAGAFLSMIESDGSAVEMVFPNVQTSVGGSVELLPELYFSYERKGTYVVSLIDETIASVEVVCGSENTKLIVKGLKAGQTKAMITAANGEQFEFVITVSQLGGGNGWL